VNIYIANNLEEYVDSIEHAILHGDKVGNSARKYLKKHFSSQSLANSFELLLATDHI